MDEALPKRPLDVLLSVMTALYDDGRMKEAADIAKAAAPYVHPRVVGRNSTCDLAQMSDEELGLGDPDAHGRAEIAGDVAPEPDELG